MNMQMSDLMMSLPRFKKMFCILYSIKFENVNFLLKHDKTRPHIKIYRSKHYFAFIQGGYNSSFTFS